MYLPGALLRISRKYPVLRSIKLGKRPLIKKLTVFWAVFVPLFLAFDIFSYAIGYPLDYSTHLTIVCGMMLFCSQLMLLVEGDRPLLAAWLSISGFLLSVVVFTLMCFVAYRWFGAIGVVVWAMFVVGCVIVDQYRHGSNSVEPDDVN